MALVKQSFNAVAIESQDMDQVSLTKVQKGLGEHGYIVLLGNEPL